MTVTTQTRYFPLYGVEFDLPSRPFEFSPGLWIEDEEKVPPIASGLLSPNDLSQAREASFWLRIEPGAHPNRASSEAAHLFVFVLGLVRPHRGTLRFKFFCQDGSLTSGTSLGTSATFNRFDVDDTPLSVDDLQAARRFFEAAIAIAAEDRLGLALSLSVSSTWAERWHVATMLATAAIESLLTCSEAPGSTKRLSQTCAALLDPGGAERHAEFDEVYKVRCKIMHGRSTAATAGERLQLQARCHRLLRELLRRVLIDPAALSALNDTDDVRRAYLSALLTATP